MTRYAYDARRAVITCQWQGAEEAWLADDVVTAPNLNESLGTSLAEALTGLSEAMWQNYEAAGRDFITGLPARVSTLEIERRVRGADLDPIDDVTSAASWLGLAVTQAAEDGRPCLDAILAEIDEEYVARLDAEDGHFRDRATQALHMSRDHATQAQVNAAWECIVVDPLGAGYTLRGTSDPTSACVAYLGWLQAAVRLLPRGPRFDAAIIWYDPEDDFHRPTLAALDHLLHNEAKGTEEAVVALIDNARQTARGHVPPRPLITYDDRDGLPERWTPLNLQTPGPDLLTTLHGAAEAVADTYLHANHEHYAPALASRGLSLTGPNAPDMADDERAWEVCSERRALAMRDLIPALRGRAACPRVNGTGTSQGT